MTTADDVLAVAISQLGYQEGANNWTKYGAWYGLQNQPWCDMFVSWCFDQAGGADIGGHFAYCPSHVNWFKNQGRWYKSGPQRGDVIFYDWDLDGIADHVGLVENVLDGTYPGAIEGNSSDGNTSEGLYVARHARATKWILGYGRPAYSGTSAYRPPIDTSEEDDMPWTEAQLRKFIADEVTHALRSEGVSGAADMGTAQRADGSWPVGAKILSLITRGTADSLRAEGVSGVKSAVDAIKAKLGA